MTTSRIRLLLSGTVNTATSCRSPLLISLNGPKHLHGTRGLNLCIFMEHVDRIVHLHGICRLKLCTLAECTEWICAFSPSTRNEIYLRTDFRCVYLETTWNKRAPPCVIWGMKLGEFVHFRRIHMKKHNKSTYLRKFATKIENLS